MSWRVESAMPLGILRELPDALAQSCFLRPPRELPAPGLLALLDEVHRVLRDDGTLWIVFPGRGHPPLLERCASESGWLRHQGAESLRRGVLLAGGLTLLTKRADFHFQPRALPIVRCLRAAAQPCPAHATPQERIGAGWRPMRRAWCQPAGPLSAPVIEWCILASTPPRACGVCGAPWRRPSGSGERRPGCAHADGHGRSLVLDLFCGTGAAGVAAIRLERNYLGVEPDPDRAIRTRARLREIRGGGR